MALTKSQRIIYNRRKDQGQCVLCGKEDNRTAAGFTVCRNCENSMIERRRYRSAMRIKRSECIQCGHKDSRTVQGFRYCESCAERQRISARKWREAHV